MQTTVYRLTIIRTGRVLASYATLGACSAALNGESAYVLATRLGMAIDDDAKFVRVAI